MSESLNLKDWLDAYDGFLAEQAAQREKEPKRECGRCSKSSTAFCGECFRK
jgi:hypothetical protein